MTRRPLWLKITILAVAATIFLAMLALGIWQVQRLSWKRDLIAQVETLAYGDPTPLPLGTPPEYLHVAAKGEYRHDKSLTVKAVTELGPGFWVMTPLEGARTVWINRGFVPSNLPQTDWTAPAGPQRITGLIRLPRPGGTLLESNDPETGRWVSADIAAMAAQAGIEAEDEFYIDAAHQGAPADWPRGGLTRLEFRNSHLSYALTWFAMAALFLGAMIWVIRDMRSEKG